jgi:hypothetical protein
VAGVVTQSAKVNGSSFLRVASTSEPSFVTKPCNRTAAMIPLRRETGPPGRAAHHRQISLTGIGLSPFERPGLRYPLHRERATIRSKREQDNATG